MAITTYAELQTALQNWSARGTADTDFNSRMPEFIALFEAFAKDALRNVRFGSKKNASFTMTGEYTDLPSDFIAMEGLALLTTPRRSLDFMPSAAMDQQYGGEASGLPEVYCIENNQIRLGPAPDGTYTARITYYNLPSLSGSQTTNWLLTQYPNAYLYGSLHEWYLYDRDDDAAAKSMGLRDSVIDRINTRQRANTVSGPLQARPDFVVP